MLIGILSFYAGRAFLTLPLFIAFAMNTSPVRAILAVVMFCGVALMFMHQTRTIGTIILVASIITYAATVTLLPYYEVLATVSAIALAVAILVIVKRWTIPAIRRAQLPAIAKVLLYLV